MANRVYSTFVSSLLTVGMRWTDRAIAIATMVILARLLAPQDFGVIAMASVVVGLADVLLNFGVHVALIRDANATQDHYDSAWTLGLLQSLVTACVVVVAAPWAAAYFQDARVEAVVRVLAISMILTGLNNIGTVEFQKNMQFGAEFRLLFFRRIAGLIAVMVSAYLLRSYWALVIGNVIGALAGTLLTYALHPMRPRISFKKFGDIFSVSQWMLISNIGDYFRHSLDRLLVGRWSSASTMGAYALADDVSSLPSVELLAPINRALFPVFARVRHDPQLFKETLLLAQGVQSLLAIPAAIGLAAVAADAVPLLLGDNWHAAVPFVQVLALVNIVQALTASGNYGLITLGLVRSSAAFVWAQVIVLGALALTVFLGSDGLVIAWLRLAATGAALWLLFWLVLRAIPTLRVADLVSATWRPTVSAAAMGVAVLLLSRSVELAPIVGLSLKIVVGAAVYALVLLALWWFAGRPRGAESYVLDKLLVYARPVWGRMLERGARG